MNMRRMPFVMLIAASALAMACADNPSGENAPQPSGAPTGDTAPSAMPSSTAAAMDTSTAAAMTTAAPAMSSAAVVAPPPAKPAKEKIVGKWQFSFEGEPKAKAEEEGKKKFAKEKDTKKFDAFMKQHEDEAAGEWIEFTADTYTSHVTEKGKDKVVLEVKYEVVKDDNTTLVTKAGKDKPKVGKIDPKTEVTTVFKDDNTIEMMDPVKKIKLVFKRK
jgi:hypothetical protein